MITVQIDTSRAIAKMDRLDGRTRSAIRGTVISLTRSLRDLIRSKLQGPVLNYRSGRLYNSIKQTLVEGPTYIFGQVSADTPYAAIHEYGGTIKHPGSSKFQSWQGAGGAWVYTMYTKPHDIPMPERSYMRSSLADMRNEIVERLTAAARSAARAA